MAKAQSVVDVILGEAASGSPQQRYDDMVAVASAMVNRSRQLGVPLEDVVGLRSQFNAYGRSLPPGADRYRTMAERALNDVLSNGPVHTGTFYATPSASGNLPRGLSEVTRTSGHIYYSDPQNRSINTAVGYRAPNVQPIAYNAVPTPRPDSPFDGLLGTSQPAPQTAPVTPVQRQALGPPTLRPFSPGEFVTNPDGTYSTERTATIQDSTGRWANAPSLWMGAAGPVDLADNEEDIRTALETYERSAGVSKPRYSSLDKAVSEAEKRSLAGGAFSGSSLSPPDITPPREPQMAPFDPQRFGPGPSLEQFDRGRFGVEAPVTRDALAAALMEQRGLLGPVQPQAMAPAQAQPFDYSRFGPSPVGPRMAPAEPARATVPAPTDADFAREVDDYRMSIGKPPVNAEYGLLSPPPAMEPPLDMPVGVMAPQQAGVPGYNQPRAQQPMQTQSMNPQVQQRQQTLLGQNPFGGMGMRTALGGVGAGILGGMLGGAPGALIGGLLGREIAGRTYFPPAPSPVAGSGDGGLNDYGRQVQRESEQFDRAVSSGKSGLW